MHTIFIHVCIILSTALVFWSNRLDFVAEMDVIANNFSRKGQGEGKTVLDAEESTMGELWKKFMYLFDDDMDERSFGGRWTKI